MLEKNNRSGGIGFVGLLAIVFVTLKLLGKIDWTWWWVLSPLWIMPSLILVVIGVYFTVIFTGSRRSRRKNVRRI